MAIVLLRETVRLQRLFDGKDGWLRARANEPRAATTAWQAASRPAATGVRLGSTVLSAFASTRPGGDPGAHALDADTHGVALLWSAADGRTGLRTGLIRETDTLFGAGADGVFGTLSSGLSWVGAPDTFEAGGWRDAG